MKISQIFTIKAKELMTDKLKIELEQIELYPFSRLEISFQNGKIVAILKIDNLR